MKHGAELPHALVEHVVTLDGTLSQRVNVDVLPAGELDEILDILLDPGALGREERIDARGELSVEGVDVEHELTDGAKGFGAVHLLLSGRNEVSGEGRKSETRNEKRELTSKSGLFSPSLAAKLANERMS